jgi:hypothetical protein
MTTNQSEQIKESVEASLHPTADRIARWLEDPFASALLATAVTATAIAFVLTGMSIVNFAIN